MTAITASPEASAVAVDVTIADAAAVAARHAYDGAQARRLTETVVSALSSAGVFRLRTPRRYGGAEASAAELVQTATTIAAGDGSAGWVAAVTWIPTWMAAQFPDAAQDDVFAGSEGRVCGTLSPGGVLEADEVGTLRLNGRWGFISGAHHADWQVTIAMTTAPDGAAYPVAALVPVDELKLDDDWDAWGLSASGSISTIAENVAVPSHRVLPLPVVLEGCGGASESNATSSAYFGPLLPTACVSSVGVAVGLAEAARSEFADLIGRRAITYTGYQRQADAPITHLEFAAADQALAEARFHADSLATLVDRYAAEREPWTKQDRVRARGLLGAAVGRAQQACDIFSDASGGSSVYRKRRARAIKSDLDAISLHALMHPKSNQELYGRGLAGLEPDTLYF